MKVNPKAFSSLGLKFAPVGILVSFGVIFHFVPSFYKKEQVAKPKSLGEILNRKE